jgi:hypothetical protein
MIASLLTLVLSDPACDAAFERVRSEGSVQAAYVSHVAFAKADPGDGQARWFLIDTGANRSALDRAVAENLGLADEGSTTVEGTAGVVQVSSTTMRRFSLGGLSMALSPTVSDLSGLRGPNGEAVAGILGGDAFGRSVLTLDFERGRLAVAPANEASRKVGECGRGAALVDDNGIPRIEGELDGRPVWLRYDSGAGLFDSPHLWINLSQPQYAAVLDGREPTEPIQTLGASGTGGQLRLPVYQGQSFRIGTLEWAQPRLIVQPPQGYFAREEAVGFLGNAAFSPFGVIVIDFADGRLRVPPAG